MRIRCNGYTIGTPKKDHQEIPDQNSNAKDMDKGQYGSVQKEKDKGTYLLFISTHSLLCPTFN